MIGAETFSRILDWEDRGTCVLFGDGAGAVVLQAAAGQRQAGRPRHPVRRICTPTAGHYDMLYVDGGPSSTGTAGYLRMEGREVFRHAVVKHLREAVDAALAGATGSAAADIDWLVPHQANRRIIDGMGQQLGICRRRRWS